ALRAPRLALPRHVTVPAPDILPRAERAHLHRMNPRDPRILGGPPTPCGLRRHLEVRVLPAVHAPVARVRHLGFDAGRRLHLHVAAPWHVELEALDVPRGSYVQRSEEHTA